MERVRRTLVGMVVACTAIASFAAVGASRSDEIYVDIESQALIGALRDWEQQTQLRFIAESTDLAATIVTPRVQGRFTPEAALARLLEGAPLTYAFLNDGLVGIKVRPKKKRSASQDHARGADPTQLPAGGEIPRIEDVLVVGTHIRGVQANASPVFVIDRQEIDASGLTTTEQLIQKLPLNFNGGISGTNLSGPFRTGGEDAATNFGFGTGTNLRGLGNDSTLVLLNGRRVAPAGFGYAVDVSMIPLDAVDRIEVLADGASALYGSDAVAGVVNIQLRQDFHGAQTSAGYGIATTGQYSDSLASQLFGTKWATGSALVSYHYHDQTHLDAADRSATRTVPSRTDLLPTTTLHAVLVSASQAVTERVTLFTDATFATRDGVLLTNFGSPADFDIGTTNYGGSIGAIADLAGSWRSEVAIAYNRTDTILDSVFPAFDFRQVLDTHADVATVDVKADGTVFELPAGPTKLAVGSQFRQETYNSNGTVQTTLGTKRRNVGAAYAEMRVPVVGGDDEGAGGQRVEVSLAGRYEHYDDFGSETNPKLGILWSPTPGWSIRASAGRSFRAPLLFELDEHSFRFTEVLRLPDASSTSGSTAAIVLFGNNPDLNAERATSWTAGVDLESFVLPGATLSLTYFETDYSRRIATPVFIGAVHETFLQESIYAAVITRNPSIDHVSEIFDGPNIFNPDGLTPVMIEAIVDNRLRNIARRHQSGLDLDASFRAETRLGHFSAHIAATYSIETHERTVPMAPSTDFSNAVYLPVDLRARGGGTWAKGQFVLSGWVNYIDGYNDRRSIEPTAGPPLRSSVASWTTVDLDFSYDSGRRSASWLLDGLQVAFSVQNVFDRDPPFVSGPFGVNFDTANANALGRLVSLRIRKML